MFHSQIDAQSRFAFRLNDAVCRPCLTDCLHIYFWNFLWNKLGCLLYPQSGTLRLQLSFSLYSLLTSHYPLLGTVWDLDGGSFLESFLCKCRIFLRDCRDAPSAVVGAEWHCWISNSLPLAGVTFKRFSLNEALAVPGVALNHKLEQAKMHWSEDRERGAPAGALCPPAAPSASCSPPPAHKGLKQLFFVWRVFVVVVVVITFFFSVPCPSFQREEWIFDCSN